jgi:hypothetical protein
MEPVAVAGYVTVAANAVLAIILGALAGAIAWAVNRSLLWVGLSAAGIYLAGTVLLGSSRLAAAAVVGMPPLLLTLLISWLTARYLEARASVKRIWATPVALCGALLLGFLWLLLFRLGFRTPVLVALAADVGLIVLLFRARRAVG